MTLTDPATATTANWNDMRTTTQLDTKPLSKNATDKELDMNALTTDTRRPPGIDPPDDADSTVSTDDAVSTRTPAARCADGNGTMVGLFFSDHVVDIARAKAMCGLCPLSAECLAGALEREEPWGVWGGELLSGGRIIGDKRPCGRPPKNPRPPVVYDEMGPVGVALTV